MINRCSKYEGEQSEWHPGELVWPGIGYPYLGPKLETLDAVDYVPVVYFYSKLFDLSNQQDYEHYVWVNDRIVNGWFIQYNKQVNIQENEGKVNVRVYMEWGQVYLTQTKKRELPDDHKRPFVWL